MLDSTKRMVYKKSQIGWLATGLFAAAILFLSLAYVNQWGAKPLTFIPFIVIVVLFIAISALFYKLTVEIDGSTLRLIYGIGLIRISFRIDELEQVEIIKTPWYYGLGIRITPKGMLYNIQGSKALIVRYLSKGKRKSVMVGTPEPEKLKKALEDNWRK